MPLNRSRVDTFIGSILVEYQVSILSIQKMYFMQPITTPNKYSGWLWWIWLWEKTAVAWEAEGEVRMGVEGQGGRAIAVAEEAGKDEC